MDGLFGNEGRMDGLSTLRQRAALQIFMPAGRALLGAYEEYDPLDSRAEIAASLGDLLPQPPTPQVLAFINGEVQREAGSDAFDILHTPLVIRLADLHAAFLSDRIGIGRCLRLLAEVVALYTCDVLLLTGRPARFPGVQALLRHLQPLPASRILPLGATTPAAGTRSTNAAASTTRNPPPRWVPCCACWRSTCAWKLLLQRRRFPALLHHSPSGHAGRQQHAGGR